MIGPVCARFKMDHLLDRMYTGIRTTRADCYDFVIRNYGESLFHMLLDTGGMMLPLPSSEICTPVFNSGSNLHIQEMVGRQYRG